MSKADLETFKLQYDKWRRARLKDLPPNTKLFEYFCADQFQKNRNLSYPEVLAGQVDRDKDGGVDGFYCFFNNVLLNEDQEFDMRTDGKLELKIFQCRENRGFAAEPISKFGAFIEDLLGGKKESEYLNEYHNKLLRLMKIFQKRFKELRSIPGKPPLGLDIEFFFITRKDTEPNQSALNRAKKLQTEAGGYYNFTTVQPVRFINASRLWTQSQLAPPTKKIIPVAPSVDAGEGWVALAKLKDYYEFLKTVGLTEIVLDEQLFDSNVRGYNIKSGVNTRIARTLEEDKETEFWLLNNGITILCSNVTASNQALEISDPQIVNGLQTSRRIFEYYKKHSNAISETDNRRILIRAIKTEGTNRSDVIRATNDQNPMPAEAFLSTLRIQKQIEQKFAENGFFYERRKGYYKAQFESATQIIEVVYLTQAILSIMLQKPHEARGRPKDYYSDKKREQIWGMDDDDDTQTLIQKEPFDLEVYLRCVEILRHVDSYFAGLSLSDDSLPKNLRCYIALDISARAVSNAHCPPPAIMALNVEKDITIELLDSSYKRILKLYAKHGGDDNASKNKLMTNDLNEQLQRELSPKKKK